MRKFKINGFYIVAMTVVAVAAFQEKWGIAVWMTLVLILIELEQIHDTIKKPAASRRTHEKTL